MPRRAIFILGMHRSGTSLLTALLHLAGVELGSDVLLGAAEENRHGFWEHREVVQINDELLARLGLSWFVPSPLPRGYPSLACLEPLTQRAVALLQREFTSKPLWAIKDPRLCRLQEFWENACAGMVDDIRAVHIFRHPLEVADSLMTRNRMPAEQALLLWLFHNLEAVLHPRTPPALSVPMQRLVEEPAGTVSRILAGVGVREPIPADAVRRIRRFVDPTLRHHHFSPVDDRLATPVGTLALRCHDCLEKLASGDDTRAALAELQGELLGLVSQRRQALASRAARTVDVIVPVYGGYESTIRCIESVLNGGGRPHVVVINDASPEPMITQRLRDWAKAGAFQLIENQKNAGFVAAANRGIALHPDRDIVLLNADTVVPPGWLDRLQHAAYSNEWIGTVTPFSNNATLCSYPLPHVANKVPAGHDAASLDAIFQAANPGLCLDIPTAVGFCMYIRRECLDAAGAFDEGSFGRGYGEETDFSMRAMKKGWRNVAAADVYVYHEGRVSFGAEADTLQARAAARMHEMHPNYGPTVERFLAEDPLAFAREMVDTLRIARRGATELELVTQERKALFDMRRRSFRHDKESLLGENRRFAQALSHAESLVAERDRRIGELSVALHTAERLATGHGSAAANLDGQLRTLSAAKDEAERIATLRLQELADRDRQLRDTAAALAAAETLAAERLEQAQRLDAAKNEAERIATEQTRAAADLDGQLRSLSAAKDEAERIATLRLEELADRDRQLRDTAAALAAAETIAAERLDETRQLELAMAEAERIATEQTRTAADLDGRLHTLSAAKDEAERIATLRLRELADRDRQLRDTAAALTTAEKLAAERLATIISLDDQLRATAHALDVAETLAHQRLSTCESLSRQVMVYMAGAIEQPADNKP